MHVIRRQSVASTNIERVGTLLTCAGWKMTDSGTLLRYTQEDVSVFIYRPTPSQHQCILEIAYFNPETEREYNETVTSVGDAIRLVAIATNQDDESGLFHKGVPSYAEKSLINGHTVKSELEAIELFAVLYHRHPTYKIGNLWGLNPGDWPRHFPVPGWSPDPMDNWCLIRRLEILSDGFNNIVKILGPDGACERKTEQGLAVYLKDGVMALRSIDTNGVYGVSIYLSRNLSAENRAAAARSGGNLYRKLAPHMRELAYKSRTFKQSPSSSGEHYYVETDTEFWDALFTLEHTGGESWIGPVLDMPTNYPAIVYRRMSSGGDEIVTIDPHAVYTR